MIKRAAIGAFFGLAWGASLRAWMTVLALKFGERPQFTWVGTFGAILLPAALVGAVLGAATYEAQTSGGKRWRWAALSPLALMLAPAVVTENFFTILFTTGLGGGAIGVALIGLFGGYAFSGFGPLWLRSLSGLLGIGGTLVAGFFLAGGAEMAAPNARDVFVALLFVLLMAVLIAGVSAPSRYSAPTR